MTPDITGLHDWLQTPAGQLLLRWQQQRMDAAVADIFGYQALQLGLSAIDALACNRMPHRWLALDGKSRQAPASAAALARHALTCDFAALPFGADTLDLVVLAHTLDLNANPHATLREVQRVLVHEGKAVIIGLNPASLWGWRQRRARLMRRLGLGRRLFLPAEGQFIGPWRLADWLRLLGFEVLEQHFGIYQPASQNENRLRRNAWLERVGSRWWPVLGAAYCIVAVKRQHGMRLIGAAWKTARRPSGDAVSVANSVMKPNEHDRQHEPG